MRKNGLERVDWHGKCNPDELLKGSYDVAVGHGGTYAFVFDNTFSKSTAKTVHFSQRVLQADVALVGRDGLSGAFDAASLKTMRPTSDVVKSKETASLGSQPSCISDGRHLRGVMLKKRRKKLQGYARRYFSLDYKYGTLNYFTAQNSSILRGSMPIKLCVVSARETSRDIYIDSGMEVWNVKPLNPTDFKTWVSALEVARLGATAAHNSPLNYSQSLLNSMESSAVANRLSFMLNGDAEVPHKDPPNDTTQIFARMEKLVHELETTATKAKKEVDKEKSDGTNSGDAKAARPGPGPQRRSSFWKRRASRQPPQIPTSSSNNASGDLDPTEVPPLPASPLLLESFSDVPSENLSQLNLKDTLASSSNNTVLKEISTELSRLSEEFKTLLADSKHASRQILHSHQRSLDATSIFSEEFFDAEEFNNPDGVVYLDQNESSSEEELLSEDDSPSDDDVRTFTNSTSRLPTPFGHRDDSDEEEDKDLYPLSELKKPVIRRKTIPMAVANPPNFLTIIRKNVGKDMSSVAMPVTANEPLNILQRFVETFEHTNLIDKALEFPVNSPERIMYIATFAAVFLSSSKAKERSTRKPFNPLLGETFELVRKEQGMRLIAEKVSHRPQIMAIQAESAGWTIHYSPSPHQQIWGKSVELNNKGTMRVTVISTGEVYEWSQATTFLRNLLAGEKYSEPVGNLTVSCSNGWRSVYEYKAGGMFSGRSEDLTGRVFSPDGKAKPGYTLAGKWTSSIEMTTPSGKNVIWTTGALIDGYAKRFGFTEFAASLNEITEVEDGLMAPTDTRLRPDQRMYENGDCDGAEEMKLKLEQQQRVRRSELENLGELYRPTFFELDEETGIWSLRKGPMNYWNRRKRGDWRGVLDLFEGEAKQKNMKRRTTQLIEMH